MKGRPGGQIPAQPVLNALSKLGRVGRTSRNDDALLGLYIHASGYPDNNKNRIEAQESLELAQSTANVVGAGPDAAKTSKLDVPLHPAEEGIEGKRKEQAREMATL